MLSTVSEHSSVTTRGHHLQRLSVFFCFFLNIPLSLTFKIELKLHEQTRFNEALLFFLMILV